VPHPRFVRGPRHFFGALTGPVPRVALAVGLLLGGACSQEASTDDEGSGGTGAQPSSGGTTGGVGLAGAGGAGTSGSGAGGNAGASGLGGAGMSGASGSTSTCAAGLTNCSGSCVDTTTNAANCGACGVACEVGGLCSASTCSCLAGLTPCASGCEDLLSDGANCGACGLACPTGQVCSAGTCATSCALGLTLCAPDCVDTTVSPTHCGACGAACVTGQTCNAGSCQCQGGQVTCNGACTDTMVDPLNCGVCGAACATGASCVAGSCIGGMAGAGGGAGMGGAGAAGASGAGMGGAGMGGAGMGGAGAGGAGTGGTAGAGTCDPGSTSTAWATTCPTSTPACTAGTWTAWGSSSPENYPFRYETEHFAFYWPDGRNVTLQQAQTAGAFLEDVVWETYMGSPIFWPEPDCNTANKRKTSIHIIENGLYGGCNNGRPGIWVGPGAMADHWGLGHEFMHSMQCMQQGFQDCGAGGCWIHESHANWMPHQLDEYRDEVHCSEMLVNAPHLYYGSTRDRYCNWQFFEFLKDKHCYKAVNDMWTATAPSGQRDPWNKLALNMGWNAEQLNDVFGEWAMHNITWDYKNPPPTNGSNQGSVYRGAYGQITSTTTNTNTMRQLRVTDLEPLDGSWATNRRFQSPNFWAPQRWGYNVVRLYPDAGATSVTVKFRGVTQSGANSGWRWGLVATDSGLTTSRYSALQRGADGELTFCISPSESVWLVVVGAPTVITKVIWDQAYPSIYRYPYMVEFARAWPEGFRNGQQDACPSNTQRHSNGGGCAPSGLATTVYVGPYAQVLGGTVSGSARIEDHATILSGATVSGGTVGALSVLQRFTVSGTANVQTTFYPPGFFESGQGLSGSARLFGDVEYRGQGLNKSSGSFYGFVDTATASATINDVTIQPPYTWR